ncbi:hypothetical protein O6H91_21G062300 [Diphasiastrum complanatum]|uniref:Uncharacterized protein n=1 Tax=Diphasiastrum complanatum TaxID=34168 RepID=A0ACC2AL49_DIPCM|nr:hypothetical protein O6H91_21G062300 [Diphasiastrum complanatum]
MLQFAGDYPCFLPASASTLRHHRYDNDGKELLHKPRALHSLQVGVMPHVRVHTNHGRWNGREAGEADSQTACQEMENVLKFDGNWNAAAVAVVAMDVSSSSKMAGLEGWALPGVSCPSVSEERGERGAAERGVLAKLKGMQSWLRLWPTVSTKEVFVTIQDSLRHHYVWEGWGMSLCWWANFAGGLPKQDMDSVLDLLFDHAKGLGLNIVRYNIGGGSNPAFDTNMRPFADIPGFRPGGPSTPYDWTADERQRNVLLGAMERGVTVTEAFSNSPPFWMTISGSVTGNIGWGKDNLHPNYYDAFVDYLTTIVKHFEEAWGIHFDTINPFNEPVEGWWNIDRRKKSQEGCNFSIPTISKVLLSLQKSLDEQNISTKISALDSWSQNTCQVLLRMEEDCLKAIHQVNVHTYVNSPTREEDAQRQKGINNSTTAIREPITCSTENTADGWIGC